MIELYEFIQLMLLKSKDHDPEDEIKAVFDIFDVNKDGAISHQELRDGMAKFGEHLTDKEVEQLIKDVDLDGNGELDFKEFLAFVNSL